MAEPAKILALGSINADFQVRVDRRPEPSETLIGHDFMRLSGGKAANVAFLAHKLGCAASLLGRVGQDDLARQALEPLRAAGIDLSGVTQAADHPTGVSMITVPPDGKKGIVLAPGANAHWSDKAAQTVMKIIAAAPAGSVLVLDCEIPVTLAEAAAETARRRSFLLLLDPSPADAVTERLLALVDIVTPNPVEAQILSGIKIKDEDTARRAASALARKGPRTICMKLPKGGCLLHDAADLYRIKGPEAEVTDSTGAGDAFAGAMAVALAQGQTRVDAARTGVAAADIAVAQYGSQPAYPDRARLEQRLRKVQITRWQETG